MIVNEVRSTIVTEGACRIFGSCRSFGIRQVENTATSILQDLKLIHRREKLIFASMNHAELISAYGYKAVFGLLVLGIIGLPVPDEALLTFVGYLSFKGEMHLGLALLTAFLGSSCGITISYGLGRLIGLRAIARLAPLLHIDSDDITHAQAWLQHWGPYALPLAYFIPGVRHLAALLAGVGGLPLTRFASFAYAGAILWCSTFISIGYGLGAEWSRQSPLIHRTVVILALVVITTIAMVFVLWRRRNRKRPPK